MHPGNFTPQKCNKSIWDTCSCHTKTWLMDHPHTFVCHDEVSQKNAQQSVKLIFLLILSLAQFQGGVEDLVNKLFLTCSSLSLKHPKQARGIHHLPPALSCSCQGAILSLRFPVLSQPGLVCCSSLKRWCGQLTAVRRIINHKASW